MELCIKVFIISTSIFQSNGVSWRRQLDHIARARLENLGISKALQSRRFYQFDPRELSSVLGVPSRPSHLPEAEPILPGHTLLKPTLGMLKSAIKFPHRELEDGAGVYGNMDNLGLRYDSRNERLMYSGFRRFPSDYIMVIPSPSHMKYEKPRFKLKSTVLDLDRRTEAKKLLKILEKLNIPALKGYKVLVAAEDGNYSETKRSLTLKNIAKDADADEFNNIGRPSKKDYSFYLNGYKIKHGLNKGILRDEVMSNMGSDVLHNKEVHETRTLADNNDSDGLAEEKAKKTNWLLASKDSFNHIKIIQEAPEIDEFIPKDEEKIRQWWFYNADDYQPFSGEKHQ